MITSAKLLSLGFLSIGVFILMQIVLPLASFKIWEIGQKYSNQLLISPEPPRSENVLGVSIKKDGNFPYFLSTLSRTTKATYEEFNISIPSIKLNNSPVLVDSNDLSKKLAHLPGSSLPGEKGNVFISGHSAISWFFGDSTKAIFARLLDVKKGDKIILTAGGTSFTYQIMGMKEVNPSDLSVIVPPDDQNRYISLMTCVPPGLNTKRLVVLGKMI